MELDSRKNETKDDLKRLDLQIEVRHQEVVRSVVITCHGMRITGGTEQIPRNVVRSAYRNGGRPLGQLAKFRRSVFPAIFYGFGRGQLIHAILSCQFSAALSGFLVVIVLSMELLGIRQPSTKAKPRSPQPPIVEVRPPEGTEGQQTLWT